MTDEELISALAAGGNGHLLPAAAAHLVQRVKFVCRAEFKSSEVDYRESVERVWMKLTHNARSFQGYGKPGAARSWLHTVIKRCILDEINWKRRFCANAVPLDEYLDEWREPKLLGLDTTVEDLTPSPGSHSLRQLLCVCSWITHVDGVCVDEGPLLTVFYTALRAMFKDHPKFAQVVLLSVTCESPADAARRMNIAPGTFANYVTTAKKLFRSYLPKDWESLLLETHLRREGSL